MDGGAPKAGGGKAALPVPAGSDANAGAARVARHAPLPEDAAPAAAATGAGSGSGGGEEEDDEQVERFYALLDNIRAMRGAYGPSDGDCDGTGADGVETGGGSGARKRLRAAEPPWRPAFRLEDFEEPSPMSSDDAARRAKTTTNVPDADAEAGGARPPAVASAPPPPRRAGVRLDGGRKSI
ncbi:hypothetical protein BAE44_0020143 [Dichanthelium oligosanthes]|uniref:NRR repressor homolog 1 n=1 Tax=Dichanthelium oligosanthes TaxID=888268 RepID=A0A1E5V172_9POAL|nr:hypothetical protein BAE44_0020143 [Dichanthelium oligosanthes]